MKNFWSLLRESVIIQGLITLVLVTTVCIMAIEQIPFPDFLIDVTLLVVGFWFGSKVQNLVNRSDK